MPASFTVGVPEILALLLSNVISCGSLPSSSHVRGFVPVFLMD